MRKVLLFCLVFVTAASFAVPAKKGIRQTITLTDGTQVTVELRGDEHAHWWQSDDGQRFLCDSTGAWKTVTEAEMAARAKNGRQRSNLNLPSAGRWQKVGERNVQRVRRQRSKDRSVD